MNTAAMRSGSWTQRHHIVPGSPPANRLGLGAGCDSLRRRL